MYRENYNLKNIRELKEEGRLKLRGNWGTAALVCFIIWIITSSLSSIDNIRDSLNSAKFLGLNGDFYLIENTTTKNTLEFISFLISGALYMGSSLFFIKLIRNKDALISDMLFAFRDIKLFFKTFLLELLRTLFIILWSLLLIVPGVIASLKYSMSYYILIDNPELSAMEAIDASSKMMNGHKSKLFKFVLSFIGWAILGIFTFGIAFIWISPYYEASKAAFYENLKNSYKEENISSEYTSI